MKPPERTARRPQPLGQTGFELPGLGNDPVSVRARIDAL